MEKILKALTVVSLIMLVGCKSTQPLTMSGVSQQTFVLKHDKPSTIPPLEAQEVVIPEKETPVPVEEVREYTLADEIADLAKEYLGIRYRSGGTSSSGMDCSGMVYATFRKKDMTVPRSSRDLASYGTKIDKSEAKPGDLIFFKTNGRTVINHVGIVTEITDNDIKFIHASVHRGVIISSLSEAYYTRAFVKINRVI